MAKARLAACLLLFSVAMAVGRPDLPLVPVPPPPLGVPDTPPTTSRSLPRATPEGLHQAARQRMATFDSYIVRLSRREAVGGVGQPDEVVLVRFRARPWSVYFKWLGKQGQGREVSYVKGHHGDKIHTVLAAGDFPLMPAGKRMEFAPDSALLRSASRHPVTEAGFAASVERIGRLIANVERDPKANGTLAVQGPLTRGEFSKPVWALEHTLPAGLDPTLPRGGRRTYYFHPDNQLPMLITAHDDAGTEAEYYHYDRLQAAVKLDDADFDPEQLWPKASSATARR